MTTKISSKGQVVLPIAVRRRFNVHSGDTLEIFVESVEGEPRIVMKRARKPKRPKMRTIIDRATGLPILKGPPGLPKLTSEMVKEMMAEFP